MSDENKKENEYTFVQETIRSKRKNKGIKNIAVTIGLAGVFGLVGSIVFCICLPLVSEFLGIETQQVIIGRTEGLEIGSSVAVTATVAPTTMITPTVVPTPVPTVEAKKNKEKPKVEGTLSSSMQQICQKVNRSIVKVDSMKESYPMFGQEETAATGATCGIVVGRSNQNLFIYVNKFRINRKENIFVTFPNNKIVQAEIHSEQEQLGITILSVEIEKIGREAISTVDVAEFDCTDSVGLGEAVMILGNPNGHIYSLAEGYVSNEPYHSYIVDNSITLINTTVPYCSNGDGVLVNQSGKVIGFVTHMTGITGQINNTINTCYSVKSIKPIIAKLVNGTREVYFGILASEITSEIAYKTQVSKGLYITSVQNNSPAFFADLKKGDIITEVEGTAIAGMDEFNTKINEHKENDLVEVTYRRMVNGKQIMKKVSVKVKVAA